jgi:hypothetical protein
LQNAPLTSDLYILYKTGNAVNVPRPERGYAPTRPTRQAASHCA